MINFKDIWFSAEERALEFSKRPTVIRFLEVCKKLLHTAGLLLICVLVFLFLLCVSLVEIIITNVNKLQKKEEEDQVTEISEKDLYPDKSNEPELIKKMRDLGQL